ncbi:MAG: SRPBCC family protein [Verrucomicrobiota bacterium]
MSVITLETEIHAPAERVFDLARSIDAHTASTSKTGERAVAGRTSGLIELGETVTWEATHFGVKQRLSVEITELDRPKRFRDRMINGAFAHMDHVHLFEPTSSGTRMKDEFQFSAPLGIFGRIAEKLFLTGYMRNFLCERNAILKRMAESDEWREFLPEVNGY